jgi:hypothetical protein
VNCHNGGLNSVKGIYKTFFVPVNILLIVFGTELKPNRRSNLYDSNILCPRVCNRVFNSRVGDISNNNGLLIAFVVFNVMTKIWVNWFYQYHSSIFFTSSSG